MHVSSNDGISSSILDLALHRDIWPDVHYVDEIAVNSVRLQTAISRAGLDVGNYDALVTNTLGVNFSSSAVWERTSPTSSTLRWKLQSFRIV